MELDEIAELIEMASVGLNEYNSRGKNSRRGRSHNQKI